jgi:hypothetical protein
MKILRNVLLRELFVDLKIFIDEKTITREFIYFKTHRTSRQLSFRPRVRTPVVVLLFMAAGNEIASC